MLLYLVANSRPEIAYAVHQCARFTHNPKASHGAAVKRICRYLQRTKMKGLILNHQNSLQLIVLLMRILLVNGMWKILKTLRVSNHGQAMFFLLGTVLSNGFKNCKVKSRFLRWKLNTFLCPQPCKT